VHASGVNVYLYSNSIPADAAACRSRPRASAVLVQHSWQVFAARPRPIVLLTDHLPRTRSTFVPEGALQVTRVLVVRSALGTQRVIW